MLRINNIKENKELYINQIKVRESIIGNDIDQYFENLFDLDNERKQLKSTIDSLLSQLNNLAKEIGYCRQSDLPDKAINLKMQSKEIKEKSRSLQQKMVIVEKNIKEILYLIPNVPHSSVPSGNSEKDNVVIKQVGAIPDLSQSSKPHWELADDYNLIDFELGNKITGKGFPVYKGKGAKLQRALINFFLDCNIEAGYSEYLPPHVVNEKSAFGTGQLPKFEEDLYKINSDNLYLIPTAEVPVTNLFRNTILKELPVKATAYTPCFRREAGSYGKEVRGLNRLHQFDKVEIVQIEHPDRSYKTLEQMVEHVASILDKLELPYRIVKLCGGDLGFSSALTFDFEVYSAAQERWLEVSSVSNFEDFQANRLKLRYKDKGGKNRLCHTLNGSALALPRIYAAIIENNQKKDGISIPNVLHSYTGFDIIK